jgi:hypothetical protein
MVLRLGSKVGGLSKCRHVGHDACKDGVPDVSRFIDCGADSGAGAHERTALGCETRENHRSTYVCFSMQRALTRCKRAGP